MTLVYFRFCPFQGIGFIVRNNSHMASICRFLSDHNTIIDIDNRQSKEIIFKTDNITKVVLSMVN